MPLRDVEPDNLRKWVPLITDTLFVLVAAFMLVYGTVFVTEPGKLTLIYGAGLTLLGVPSGRHLRDWLRNGKNGNGVKIVSDNDRPEVSKEDRWSHLP